MKLKILLAHADGDEGQVVARGFADRDHDVTHVRDHAGCVHQLLHRRWDAVAIYDCPGGEPVGDLLGRIRRIAPDVPSVVVTTDASLRSTARLLTSGAFDLLVRPVGHERVLEALERGCASSALRSPAGIPLDATEGRIIGRSPAMVEVYKTIVRAASTRATVLITGESGTGKELVARALHDLSPRASKRCMVIDCTAIPKSLMESELFGHVRGAFTGAVTDKRGLLEQAHGSTCMLDEIGELEPDLQAKLLRVLQEGEVRRVGAHMWTPVDVRIVAATNRDLPGMVRDGTFREDLFYRLNVVTVQLPPLRERVEDIPAMAEQFLLDAATRHGRAAEAFSRGALRRLCEYQWPGNVRQLQNTIERVVALSSGRTIVEADLPRDVLQPTGASPSRRDGDTAAALFAAGDTLEDMKRRYILHVVARTRGNIARAAVQLNVDRRSLYRMLERYNVEGIPGRTAASA
ncbi:Fis family transcriptional regulator [Luteitalea sp. TBR-22]|uniref:sigma-54-dependent transcriptional regulator n=1 Tax=Luteitalea sp. TBR-22 TaxID=2802971 RepID=UPI001AF97B7D|nr:sigma-54 dependent transcriptional regulator [Luteitalea sp. TBR-22]BCS35048.1 Fis family transcriptional regulator [Luteitalea sp. TBR-22]